MWDEYFTDSLKAGTRKRRGKRERRRVEPSTLVLQNWIEFLRIENKMELFSFLAVCIGSMDTDKQVITTHHSGIFCNQRQDEEGLAPCSHEEADTRIMVHVQDTVKQGYTKISIRTIDTDVMVLAVKAAQQLNIPELWDAFVTGKNFRILAAHDTAKALGPEKCAALPVFHAFTGCDTVLFFAGRGKKTAWDTWRCYNEVTSAFCTSSATPESVDDSMEQLECFVILLHDCTSNEQCVNQARKQLFSQKVEHSMVLLQQRQH